MTEELEMVNITSRELSSEGGYRDVTKKKRNKKMSTPKLKVILTPSLHFVSLEILDVTLYAP